MFTLCLPNFIHAMHSVFHMSILELHTPLDISRHVETPSLSVKVEEELKYELLDILDFKIDNGQRLKLLYLV